MRRILQLAAVALPALALSACATAMTVSSHVQSGLDVTPYRTYDWGPADALPTGDPRLDANPFFQDHFQGAVEKQMAARGFERTTSAAPDLLMHYHASINQRIDVGETESRYGYCYDEDCRNQVVEYEAGTLILDIVDTRTNRVIWRGWAQDSMRDVLGNPDRMERQINEAVTRMLAQFPRPL